MSGHPDHHRGWTGWRARAYAILHRDPASNRAVVEWAALDPDMDVLDIGCGAGAAVRAAAPLLPPGTVSGVDPSPDFVRIARRRTRHPENVTIAEGSAENLPFEDAAFDVAWSVHSSHHWPDVAAGVTEAHRVLRPGGRLLIAERHDPGRPWGIDAEHAATLAETLSGAGFTGTRVDEHQVGRAREFLIHGTRN